MFSSNTNPPARIQTVSDLTSSIKALLETTFPFVSVVGEVSNLRRPMSGHLYFTLKDQDSQIKAVLFKPQQRYLDIPLTDGQQIVCHGKISVYGPRGDYQIIVDTVDTQGTGVLQIAFEELKAKLAAEGLFDAVHKKAIPSFPEGITLITSPFGAAVHDFLKTAENRFAGIPIDIIPVRVQGDDAVADIVSAFRTAEQISKADVIVLCRGGGSIEDLWVFNTEPVARAIFASKMPVVTGIGHEIDFTIADFVADYRAVTPTAAAEKVVPDRKLLTAGLAESVNDLIDSMESVLEKYHAALQTFKRLLRDPSMLLQHFALRLDHLQDSMAFNISSLLGSSREAVSRQNGRLATLNPMAKLTYQRQRILDQHKRLVIFMAHILARKRQNIHRTSQVLHAVDPTAVLARGYAIVRRPEDHEIIKTSSRVEVNEELEVTFHKGRIAVNVKKKLP